MYSAYLDRFTDDTQALLLVDELQKEFHVNQSLLPMGSKAATWYLVEVEGDKIISVQFDRSKTDEMAQGIEDTMQRLKSKKSSRFKRQ